MKGRGWKWLPKEWRQKWRNHAPIDPRTSRANCIRTLEIFGPEAAAAVPKLIEVAKSDPNVRATALNALAHMASKSPQAKAFLVASLRDGDGAVKTDVAGAFVSVGWAPAEAVPLLVGRLENYVPPNEHSPVPLNEMLALSVSGPEAGPAAPLLIQYITHGGPFNAVTALRATGPAAVVALPRLLEILADSDRWATRLRPSVFAILARLGTNGTAALPALTNGLSDPNPVVRVLAIGGIANITDDVGFAVPRLIEAFENRDRTGEETLSIQRSTHFIGLSHRELAAMLLGEFGERASNALPNLKGVVDGPERGLHPCAAEAIWKISKDTNAVLPVLIAGLQSSSDIRRMLTLNVLAEMGPAAAPAVPAIRELMQSKLEGRRYCYVALRKIEEHPPKSK